MRSRIKRVQQATRQMIMPTNVRPDERLITATCGCGGSAFSVAIGAANRTVIVCQKCRGTFSIGRTLTPAKIKA